MIVKFTNAGRDKSNTAIFNSDTGAEMLIPESAFEPNLLRALLIIFCQLALLSALGLTASVLFSFPVAIFAASSILAISLLCHYFTVTLSNEHVSAHHHGQAPKESVFNIACEKMAEYTDVMMAPAMQFDSIKQLSDGILVSWGFVGKAVLFLIAIYSSFLGLMGGYFLKRKEIALPG